MPVQVKGSLLIDYARVIRANRDIDWSRWLGPEEMEVINNEVMTSAWYPYRIFRKLAWACFQGVARNDLEMTATFGRLITKNLLPVYHKVILVTNDPVASISNFARFWQNFFMGEGMGSTVTKSGENWVTYRIIAPDEEERIDKIDAFTENFLDSVAAFAYQLGGMLVELAEQAGGKSPRFEVVSEGLSQHITVHWR